MYTLGTVSNRDIENGEFAGQTTENDIVFNDLKNLELTDGLDALMCVIRNVVMTNKGELQLNISNGIPYLQQIFQDPNMIALFKSELQSSIEGVNEVENVKYIETEYDSTTSTLSYRVGINTLYGETELDGRYL